MKKLTELNSDLAHHRQCNELFMKLAVKTDLARPGGWIVQACANAWQHRLSIDPPEPWKSIDTPARRIVAAATPEVFVNSMTPLSSSKLVHQVLWLMAQHSNAGKNECEAIAARSELL